MVKTGLFEINQSNILQTMKLDVEPIVGGFNAVLVMEAKEDMDVRLKLNKGDRFSIKVPVRLQGGGE